MHAARMLWSGLGYRGGHKPLFTPIGRELYRIVKADFREIPSLLKKSLSARAAVQERPETRPKHYENGVFSP